eukprot:4200367-Pleurochrysis_carterae.AAC.1
MPDEVPSYRYIGEIDDLPALVLPVVFAFGSLGRRPSRAVNPQGLHAGLGIGCRGRDSEGATRSTPRDPGVWATGGTRSEEDSRLAAAKCDARWFFFSGFLRVCRWRISERFGPCWRSRGSGAPLGWLPRQGSSQLAGVAPGHNCFSKD